jgi:hypothetical protein
MFLFILMNKWLYLSGKKSAGHGWLTSIILATWEAEIRRTELQSYWGQKVHEIPSQVIAGHIHMHVPSQATQDTDIRRIMDPG